MFDVTGIYGLNNGELAERLDREFENLAPTTLLFEDTCPEHNKKNSSQLIRKFYLGEKSINESTRAAVTDVSFDKLFINHSIKK